MNKTLNLNPIILTNLQARRFLLAKQGLGPPRALKGKQGIMAVFDRLGCIQFDPLNMVGRNPDLVLQSRVADALEGLSQREREVIRLRYGFADGKAYTLKDLGEIFSVTRERARQIEASAIRKL